MRADDLKRLMSILLIATGVLHIVVAVFGAPEAIRIPLAVFGVIYGSLGVWLRTGGKTAIIATLAATTLGVTLGGLDFAKNGGPPTLQIMFLIDVAVIIAGVLWLVRSAKTP